jgi:hypothetical protein
MRTHVLRAVAALALVCSMACTASAVTTLWAWAYNLNGVYTPFASPTVVPPSSFDDTAFSYLTGQGRITYEHRPAAPGAYKFLAGFDLDIDFPAFLDEYVVLVGSPVAGQSWEVDDPVFGDMFLNLQAGTLDGFNAVPATLPGDVGAALGWDYALASGQYAVITLDISPNVPRTAFYLSHRDSISDEIVNYSSTLTIFTPGVVIPEPLTLVGLIVGLGGLGGYLRRRLA